MPTGTATINFDSSFPGVDETSLVISGQTLIASNSQIEAFFMADDTTTDHSANDHKYAPCLIKLICGSIVVSTSFTIYARSLYYMRGQWIVHWVWA